MRNDSQNGRPLRPVRTGPLPRRQADPEFAADGGALEAELRTYREILRRRGRLVRGVFATVVVLILVWTVLQSPVYRATALLEIRGGDADVPSIEGLFTTRGPSEEYLRTHFGLLRSAALARRVIRSMRLDTLPEFAAEDGSYQRVVENFLDRLIVDPVEESRLVRLTFEASTPELSADIVNALLEEHPKRRIEAKRRTAEQLALQVDSVEESLQKSETALRDYAETHDLPYMIEGDPSDEVNNRLGDLRGRLGAAESERLTKESLYEVVVREGQAGVVEDDVVAELEARLFDVRQEYARLSATFTDDYPPVAELRREMEHVRGLIAEAEDDVASRVTSDYRMAIRLEERLSEAIAGAERAARQLGPSSGDYHVLRQSVLANRELYSDLHSRRREAEVAAAIGATDLFVVDAAMRPTERHRPVYAMSFGLAVMLGLLLGIGAALVVELLDDTVQSPGDVPLVGELPVIGLIPGLEDGADRGPLIPAIRRARGLLSASSETPARAHGTAPETPPARWPRIDVERSRSGPLADAFDALRTSVLLVDADPQPRSILVSSCHAGAGKTTVSLNLAVSLGRLGHRVLLVDADLRRPSLHRALGLDQRLGLLHCLTLDLPWMEGVRPHVAPGVDLLPSGGSSSRTADLLSGQVAEGILRDARERYDYVVVDAPALFISASDATLLSRLVDGVLVVVRSRSTPRSQVERIPRAIPNLLGIVVNDLRRDDMPSHFADYFGGYGPDAESAPPASTPVEVGTRPDGPRQAALVTPSNPDRDTR